MTKPNLLQILRDEEQRIKDLRILIPKIQLNLARADPLSPNYDLAYYKMEELSLQELKLEYKERTGRDYNSSIT